MPPPPPSPRDSAPVFPVALLVGVLVVVRVGLRVVARGLVAALMGQVSYGGGVASDLALAGLCLHPLGVVHHASAGPEGRRENFRVGFFVIVFPPFSDRKCRVKNFNIKLVDLTSKTRSNRKRKQRQGKHHSLVAATAVTMAVVVGVVGVVAVAVAAVPSRRALTAGLALAIRGPAAAPAVPVGGGGGGAMNKNSWVV